jgi:DNA-binding MarR family transcriptional regulator
MNDKPAGPSEAQPVTWRELEMLRRNWEELASRGAEIEASAGENELTPLSLDFDEAKLAAIASSIYASRVRRTELFARSLFGEPAWDMLLILFIAKARGERLSTTDLSSRANTPHSTGLRWIGRLQKHGLLTRERDTADSRVMWVGLTVNGYSLMRRYVLDGIARFQMPLPD